MEQSDFNLEYYKIGSIHSFSNAFIAETITQMQKDIKEYKKTQIKFIQKFL